MNRRCSMLATALLASLVVATVASAASAQTLAAAQPATTEKAQGEAPAQPPRLEENVQVTATRGAIDAQTSPASGTTVLRADIERRNVVTVDQALTTIEGVYAYRVKGVPDDEAGIGMRGFSGRGTGQTRVLVLLDGQPLNDGYTGAVNWTGIPLGEIDRVEVVRGPFSSLYGGNAMGGVVNVITRPIERLFAEGSARYGTHGTGAYNGRAAWRAGRAGFAFGYDGLRTDGYRAQEVLRTPTTSATGDATEVTGPVQYLTRTGGVNYAVGMRGANTAARDGIRARVEYALGERTFANAQYVRQSSQYGWGPYETWLRDASGRAIDSGTVVFQADGAPRRLTVTPANYLGVVGGGSSSLYQAQVLTAPSSGMQVRIQAGLVDAPSDWYGSPGSSATVAGGAGSYSGQRSRGGYLSGQWSSLVGGAHALTLGVDGRFDRAAITAAPVDDYREDTGFGERTTYTQGRSRTWAVFAQDQFSISDRVAVTVGARFDDWRTYDGASQAATGAPVVPFADRAAAALTAKGAVVFQPRTGTAVRASLGTAFRSPSVYELYRDTQLSSGSLYLGNPVLDPERMVSWEVGVRHAAGTAFSVDAALYENRIRDLIFRSVDLAGDPTGRTSRMFNAGRATTRGVELALTARPVSWLTVRPTYTFTDAVISENERSPSTVGSEIPFVPRHVAAGTATALLGRVTLTGAGRYQTAVFATDTNTDTTKGVPGSYDGFFEADAAATVTMTRHLTVSLSVENLFDRHYYLYYRNPGRVMMAGVRVRY